MQLDVFEVRSCCYFVSLRTGTKIIGFISLLACFLAGFHSLELMVVVRISNSALEKTDAKEPIWDLALDIIAQAVQMTTSIFLLLGAYKETPKFIPPWLVSTVVSAVSEVVLMPSLVGRLYGIHVGGVFIEWLIFTIFFLVDDIYGLLVVFSYYRSLTPQGRDSVM